MCFSGKYTEAEVYKKLVGNGGFNAYLGTNDMRDVEKMVDAGDTKAAEVRDAFIQQMSKNIGAMATVLEGKVDQIIVTGGIAYDKGVVDGLKARCEWIAPFTVYPGEDELLALAQGGTSRCEWRRRGYGILRDSLLAPCKTRIIIYVII